MKRIAILGSTGSIGRSALSVVESHADRLSVVALAAGENSDRFVDQVRRFRPRAIAMASDLALAEVRQALGHGISIEIAAPGPDGLMAVATHPDADLVLCASSGTAALEAVLAAIACGKTIALANKEVLVMAGALVMSAAARYKVDVVPVDSEHNALHQCLHGRRPDEVKRLILTASGGPFRGWSPERLDRAAPEDALRHPTWRMGPKITIDSATLMNKGLEVIEAHWLFGMPADRIDVLVHPQSVVHSMVELTDGSIIAQLGITDMRLPIQYAFSFPERWPSALPSLDLTQAGGLDFDRPDEATFPCLGLAYRALRGGGVLPVVLNACNEVAVEAFLAKRLSFTGIPRLIESALDASCESSATREVETIEDVRAVDKWAREYPGSFFAGYNHHDRSFPLCPRAPAMDSGFIQIEGLLLTSLVAFVFVLGVLIFVHELGHFLMARKIGVRVLTFSLGFGPKVLRYVRNGTEYCVSAIPLGGYVKMAGENAEEGLTGQSDEFLSKTKWERFQVMIMGPAMNILLAIVVLWGVLFVNGAEVPAYKEEAAIVGSVRSGSGAAVAGIKAGDRIVRVNGREIGTWNDFALAILLQSGRAVTVVVVRDGKEVTLHLVPQPDERPETGDVGVVPLTRPQIRAVSPGQPADRAGIKKGDVVLAVNGQAPSAEEPLVKTINSSSGIPLRLTIVRDGGRHEVTVTPELRGDRGLIGVQLSEFEVLTLKPNLLQALQMSLEQNWESSGLIFRTIVGLFTRETSPKQLMGPVGIAQLSGGAAQLGWIPLLSLMAMISLNLGILNLLPIPVLDGGHIMIMALEGIARRDFSVRLKEKIIVVGFVLILMLMVTVIYNDLTRIPWIESRMPWR